MVESDDLKAGIGAQSDIYVSGSQTTKLHEIDDYYCKALSLTRKTCLQVVVNNWPSFTIILTEWRK